MTDYKACNYFFVVNLFMNYKNIYFSETLSSKDAIDVNA